MDTILQVNNLYKSLSKREIIKGISFQVNKGEVFGFLGPNGAGKTTTIRMIVGLIKPDKGEVLINGYDVQKDFIKAMKNLGCIVENPEMYLDLTGRENLKIFARMYGNVPKERIEEIIELIGLKDRIDDKVRKYSLGMRQRLGLGQALLPKPSLLILDEPTNGLDPVGIVEFRKIIKDLVRDNETAVFISSHMLSEIEQLCDRVAFISNGEIKSIENARELNKKCKFQKVSLITSDNIKCKDILSDTYYVHSINDVEGRLILECDEDSFSKIINLLARKNIDIEEINKVHQNLEDRFMEIVEGGSEFAESSKK
ncbi:ABC transporter ATP-binding protein [Clostridium estertheticum]|uniref:ABC transporter ATP-binding protein n=1 Tax=Clostridium estertheticum TaxID=238834 RepID=UPI0013E8FCCB|nr:ABC transporter ATP-binding protein [Clostridium estertheticum]MBZ9685632.1 ABC transporter ATP-binding protein [Clostridium estertheticum]